MVRYGLKPVFCLDRLFVNHEVQVTNSSRRQFLGISARTAGKVAATGLVSLPLLASMSKKICFAIIIRFVKF